MNDFFMKTCRSTKIKKCQPAAVDRSDLIQTEPVNSSGLACPNKKITKSKKSNSKIHKVNDGMNNFDMKTGQSIKKSVSLLLLTGQI